MDVGIQQGALGGYVHIKCIWFGVAWLFGLSGKELQLPAMVVQKPMLEFRKAGR